MKPQVKVLAVMTVLALLVPVGIGWGATSQTITLTMREFTFRPSKIALQGGVPVEIKFVNRGNVSHDFTAYDTPRKTGPMIVEWAEKTNYFHNVEVSVEGGRVRHSGGVFFALTLLPGKSATITFVPVKKGTFEFGCLIEGHYEAGQKGVFVVK